MTGDSPVGPFAAWEYKTIRFYAADTDVTIAHSLTAEAPEQVGYLVLRNSAGATVREGLVQADPNRLTLRVSVPTTLTLLVVTWAPERARSGA